MAGALRASRRRNAPAAILAAALTLAAATGAALPVSASAQATPPGALTPPSALPPVSVTFEDTSVRDVARFFAAYAGRSIVVGRGVEGTVSADIQGQRWDVALAAILASQGLSGRELESGIIVVEAPGAGGAAAVGSSALVTRVFRLSYVSAAELQPAVADMLSERGSVSTLPTRNALVVTDVPEVVARVAGLVGG